MPKLSAAEARKRMRNLSPEKSFWVNNGTVIRNLQELLVSLKKMSESTYRYHTNKEKNDFHNWIKDVIGDARLAVDFKKSRTKKSAIKKLSARLKTLKQTIKQE